MNNRQNGDPMSWKSTYKNGNLNQVSYTPLASIKDGVDLAKDSLPSLLHDLLSLGCPSGQERRVQDRLIKELTFLGYDYNIDPHGNVVVHNGSTNRMFTSHMDTVHKIITKVVPHLENGMVTGYEETTNGNYKRCVLGADDKLGMYIMLKMLENDIKGTYSFFVDEERGRKGSIAMVRDNHKWLEGIDICISFDRKGYNEIITKQRGSVCATESFACSLATEINNNMNLSTAPVHEEVVDDLNFENTYSWDWEICSVIGKKVDPYVFHGSPHGSFTDSASFTEFVHECTNVSVGYFNQHTENETFDWEWLENVFLPAWLQVNFNNVIVSRKLVKLTDKQNLLVNQVKSICKNKQLTLSQRKSQLARIVDSHNVVDVATIMSLYLKF